MPVKTISIDGVGFCVIARGAGRAAARLIIRERKKKNVYYGGPEILRYLYLVYRVGRKIKEHYIAKLF